MINRIEAEAGEGFVHLVNRAQATMKMRELGTAVVVHNGIEVAVTVNSVLADICMIYDLKRTIAGMSTAGYRR